MENYAAEGSNEFLYFLTVVVIGFILVMAFILTVWRPFVKTKEYLKMEIRRCEGKERAYWERELKKLYLRQIPFIGKKLSKMLR